MGIDSRIASAMLGLGYRIFPFEAFDSSGQLIVPDSVTFPPDVDGGLGKIASNPVWVDLYRTLSPLASHYRVFMAGVGFVNDRVQVAIFKNTNSVADATEAMNWADSYHGTVEQTLHRYAGTSYLVDPTWRTVIDKARGSLPAAQRDVEGVDPTGTVQTAEGDAPPSEEPVEQIAVAPVLLFALDLLFDLVTKATVRTKVLTTVVWYPPSAVDIAWAGGWKPIHAHLQKGFFTGHRSGHLIWNPVGFPVTIRGGGVAWKGAGLDMPHEPVQWCQALRPLANCLNRPEVSTHELGIAQATLDER